MNELNVVKKIPESISLNEITRVIVDFHNDSGLSVDLDGFIASTLDRFAMATFLDNPGWDLWICEEKCEIKAYFLCRVEKAEDNRFCYTIHQGWLCKELRNKGYQDTWWVKIKKRAKELFCKQILIYSIRDYEAYKKLLGGNMTHYASLLHLKLED
jgi:hypothetical protein